MMQFSPRFLDEIRSRITLSELIGRKIKVTRAGREFKACCPFHKEKTPSFYINDEKNFYHCFGCGAHGDVVGWTMQYENRSFPEAIEQLAGMAGLEMPKASPQEVQQARQEKDLYQLMEKAAAFFEEQLYSPRYKEAYEYISGRGFADETLSAFRVGYAPPERTILYEHLQELGFEDRQMEECGLIRKDKTGKPYSFFRERIMFPVTDKRGRIVAFGGRILPDHLRPPQRGDYVPAKYMNSSDTPLFHKGRMLYGAAHASYAAREGEPLIVAEGYLDVIACWQAGFKGAVAPLGTALTEDQIIELWRMSIDEIKSPYLCFDGDEAGRRAASRAVERIMPLLQPAQSVKIIFLPEGEDPDTLIKTQGSRAFQSVLDKGLDLVDFIFDQEVHGKQFKTPEERAALEKKIEEITAQITDRNLQYHYRDRLREKVKSLFQSQRASYHKAGQRSALYQGKKNPASQITISAPQQDRESLIYRILFCAVITHPEIFDEVEERIGQLSIQHIPLKKIRNALFSLFEGQINLDFEEVKRHLVSIGLESELAYIVNDSVFTHGGFNLETDAAIILSKWNSFWGLIEAHAEQSERIRTSI